MRVDGAPCMGEHMKAKTAINPVDGFFGTKNMLRNFTKKTVMLRKNLFQDIFICQRL